MRPTSYNEIKDVIKSMKEFTIVTICSFCKNVRQENGQWVENIPSQLESPETNLSHGICPSCAEEHFPEQYKDILSKNILQ